MSEKKNELKKLSDIQIGKMRIHFKKSILHSIVKILTMSHGGFRTVKVLKNINLLFNRIDESAYDNDQESLSYIWCIRFLSKQWLEGFTAVETIIEIAKRQEDIDNIKMDIIVKCAEDEELISHQEAKVIFGIISEALQYGYISSFKEDYFNLLEDINMNETGCFKAVSERLFEISKSLLDIKYKTNMITNTIEFNTIDNESVSGAITQTLESLTGSSNIYKTGIRRLNTLLSPGYMNGRIYLYLGLPAAGKAQPDDTHIPTPEGYRRLDSLEKGDYVFNIYGDPVKVKEIFIQGKQPTYQIRFTDGRCTRCNGEHLWTLIKDGKFQVKTLNEIKKEYIENHGILDYTLPNNGIVRFDKRAYPVDPFVIGEMLGGSLPIIPPLYIFNDFKSRMRLIKGLSRNHNITRIISNGKIDYLMKYNNEELRITLHMFLQSLGVRLDTVTITTKSKSMKMLKFTLPMNSRELRNKKNVYNSDVKIASIERVEDTFQRCILVDDPLHVYLTESFIPTHNSIMLLKTALDIRKYNPNTQSKIPGMKPCVLYITMENTFTETIERVWNMEFDRPMTGYKKELAAEMLKKKLGLKYDIPEIEGAEQELANIPDSESNIELVIQFYPYRSISTNDLYTIIQDLKDKNLEVCSVVLDYIKRIAPSVPSPDNVKMELNRIINELKALSVIYDIPVITAHQMNRSAAATVDAAVRLGKGDVSKLVGRENVGDAWELCETADVVIVLNSERDPKNGEKYMTFNVVKRRRVDSSENNLSKYLYMAHPFAIGNEMRLVDDIDSENILSRHSLISDIEIDGFNGTINATNRPIQELDDYEM